MNSFPFSDPDPKKLTQYSDSIYKALTVLDIIKDFQSFYLEWSFEVLCFTLKYLEETYDIKLKDSIFCDCMGLGLQVAAVASTFSFKELISIELSEEEVNKTLTALHNSMVIISPPIEVKIGRVQDYFIVNSDISYLDCNLLGPFLDEGLFLESFFNCCQNLQCQSFLILLTRFDGYDFESKGFDVLLYQHSKQYSHLWLCKKT